MCIVWAFIFSILSIGLMILGGLKAVQIISVIAALPLVLVEFLLIYSSIRMIKQDEKSKKVQEKTLDKYTL